MRQQGNSPLLPLAVGVARKVGNQATYHVSNRQWGLHGPTARGVTRDQSTTFGHPCPVSVCLFALLLLLSIGGFPMGMLLPAHAATEASAQSADEQMEAGVGSFRNGDFEQALGHWAQAFGSYEAAANLEGQALALVRRAEAYLALGKLPNAFDALERALGLAEQTDNPPLVAGVLGSVGNAYLLAGRVVEAKRSLESSIEIAKKVDSFQIAASALNNLGNLLALQAKFAEATTIYKEALDAARKAGNDGIAVRAMTNLTRTLVENGKYNEAATSLAEAREQIGTVDPSHDKAYGLISIGRLYARLDLADSPLRAHKAFSDAIAVADAINDSRAQSYALGYMGQLYEQAQQYDDALQFTQRAIFSAQQVGAPEALYRWQWQTGRLLKAQGKPEEAIVVYQRAIHTLQSIRQDLVVGSGSIRASFRKSVGPVFLELADLLLRRSAAVSDANEVQRYLVDARDTVELLKGAELEDYFQDDCVAALKAKTTGIDQLAPRTAALYPIILPDRTELLLSLPDGLRRFTVQVDADTLTKEVRAFRRRLEKRTTHQYLRHARQLFDWIIRPIERELKQQDVNTLVIVPDGPLRTIPMAALHDGKQFLTAKYALATTPGLTLTDPRPIKRENVQVLLSGLTESVQGFPALPNVAEELQTINSLYGGTVLQDKKFLLSNIEKELTENSYSIVHIASHAQFDSDVTKTFLLTYDTKLSMDTLARLMGLTTFREDAVELLTLSACQTAAGDDRAALGLAGIAVKSGARSVLATLWVVNDRASALLVSEFYRQLQDPSVSKATALQRAQLKLLSDRRYRHPGYWGPFLLIGNWL